MESVCVMLQQLLLDQPVVVIDLQQTMEAGFVNANMVIILFNLIRWFVHHHVQLMHQKHQEFVDAVLIIHYP